MSSSVAAMDDLAKQWDHWKRRPYPDAEYPPGSPAGEVARVDLALTTGDAAAVVDWFVSQERVDPSEPTIRKHALAALQRVLPLLSKSGRSYFEPLAEMLGAVDRARTAGDPVQSSDR